MKVTVFRLRDGGLSLVRVDGAEPIEAELYPPYRIGEGLGGSSSVRIFGPPGQLGMTADAAVRAGVLRIPMIK